MADYVHKPQKFLCRGIDLNHPVNLTPVGKYPILLNARSNQEGQLQGRGGYSPFTTFPANSNAAIHTIRILNDPLPGAAVPQALIYGAGTNLFCGTVPAGIVNIDSGYSGNPMTTVVFRPAQSPESWLYLADANRMRKVRADGTNYGIGIAPPLLAPLSAQSAPNFGVISDFEVTTGWTASGAAGSVGTVSRTPASTTISSIIYDSGSTGWANVNPTDTGGYAWMTMGERIKFATGPETAAITEVHPIVGSTTILGIHYASGTTGACIIQLSAAMTGVQINSMLRVSGTETIVVTAVIYGPDGKFSIRTSTASNHGPTAAVTGLPSFRVYLNSTHAAAEALTNTAVQAVVTLAGGATSSTGAIANGLAVDMTQANGVAIGPDDYIYLSVFIDNPNSFIEGRLTFDVDGTGNNDFQHNAYYYPFTANIFTAAATGGQTNVAAQGINQETAITLSDGLQGYVQPTPYTQGYGQQPQGAMAFDPNTGLSANQTAGASGPGTSVPGQLYTGTGQWTQLQIKVGSLQRIGADTSRTLQNVLAVQIQWTINATATVAVDSLWFGGGNGPDVQPSDANGFLYRFRFRSSLTGAKSLQSPATRAEQRPYRNQIMVTLPATTTSDPQADLADIERFGGQSDSWNYIGTISSAAGSQYADNLSVGAITSNPALETDVFQPFPVQDLPASGTCNVVGTSVTVTAGALKTAWSQGTEILINDIAYTFYNQPSSTAQVELAQNAGVFSGVPFTIASPTLLGQPLPKIWGPIGGNTASFSFGCGDLRNPGLVYIFRGNDMDAVPDTYFVEVTSPSEPIVNGCIYDGQSFAWSPERFFALRPTPNGTNVFTPIETPIGKGLFADYCFAVGPLIWFREREGIYETDGTVAQCITDEDLYPLFPHGDQQAQPITIGGGTPQTYYPPDDTQPFAQRMSYQEGWMSWDFIDTNGSHVTWNYHVATKSWWPDTYNPQLTMHYSVEAKNDKRVLGGTVNGFIVLLNGGIGDQIGANSLTGPPAAINPIACRVRTGSYDAGETRAAKVFGDAMLDADFNSQTVTVQPLFDFSRLALSSVVLPTANDGLVLVGEGQAIIDINSGTGQLARNIALDISWQQSAAPILLYEWQPSLLDKPEYSLLRASDYTDGGYPGRKYVRGLKLKADTFGATRTVQVQFDGGQNGPVLTVEQSGEQLVPYAFPVPFTAELLRLLPTDPFAWRLWFEQTEWICDRYPELIALITPWGDAGYPGMKWVQGIRLKADTGGLPVQLQVQIDGAVVVANLGAGTGAPLFDLTVTHNGQQTKPYTWTPFRAHNLRIVPLGPISIWEPDTLAWVFEPEPELVTWWVTQPTTHDLSGYQHIRDGYIALISTDDVALIMTPDTGAPFGVVIPSTGGIYKKVYFSVPPNKFKSVAYSVNDMSSGKVGFRLFLRDCEVRVKGFNTPGPYVVKQPFGDISRLSGARI